MKINIVKDVYRPAFMDIDDGKCFMLYVDKDLRSNVNSLYIKIPYSETLDGNSINAFEFASERFVYVKPDMICSVVDVEITMTSFVYR